MGLDTAARAEITHDETAIIQAEREAITGR